MSETRTVTYTVTVEVHPENWDLAYGTGTGTDAITEDVRSSLAAHVDNMMTGTGEGFGRMVSVKPSADQRAAARS